MITVLFPDLHKFYSLLIITRTATWVPDSEAPVIPSTNNNEGLFFLFRGMRDKVRQYN